MCIRDRPYTRHGEGSNMKRNTECNSVSIFNPFQWETAGLGQHCVAVSQGQPYLFGMVVKTQNPVEFAVSLTDRAGKEVYCLSLIHI